jgi:hypothetical protein
MYTDYTDQDLNELCDCLLSHPNVINRLMLCRNCLTDETGVKLARYVAASSTVRTLFLSENQFGLETYLAMAEALKVNTSLRYLFITGNRADDKSRIDAAFVGALQLNPNRSVKSDWCFYHWYNSEHLRLKAEADRLGHPTMQSLLATHLLRSEVTP